MKKLLIVCIALGLMVAFASSASAVEPQKVSGSTLASMGLGGMKPMSDQDGMKVRGKFTPFTLSWGISWANLPTSSSAQSFLNLFHSFGGGGTFAIATHNSTIAIGGGFAIAGGF